MSVKGEARLFCSAAYMISALQRYGPQDIAAMN
ncbi:hypothetical protein P775_02460 [Puniceibacterium antarcticum]|uniref:Uncharacterized protein n=1 Tax=Puniceibacterium antarcticum TaxID=1206336 RepID=A0A2G8RJZ3_9RHOB|nr:hypothetical protein P775_02460 [Puniceibacterium antarcticum]